VSPVLKAEKNKMFDILKSFESKYGYLKKKGLTIEGLAMIDPKKKKHVIKISRPLVFDNRQLPKKFEGLDVKTNIQMSQELPSEFKVNREQPDWFKKEYIWAPERFEKFVDRCSDEIRRNLGEPNMTKKEMLDALCFGDFKEHKKKVNQLIKEGKLPAYSGN
jgi:hypothetical protein